MNEQSEAAWRCEKEDQIAKLEEIKTKRRKETFQRVHTLFGELTRLGVFDNIAGMSDATHPDEINSLCDAVAAECEELKV